MAQPTANDPGFALADRRVIVTTAAPRPRRRPPLEAALIGHCHGEARGDRLGAEARERIEATGFGPALAAGDERAAGLYHLPLPLESWEAFSALFPEADDRGWLAPAVADFFRAGGRGLWLVRVPEEEGHAGFLPTSAASDLTRPEELRGLETVLLLPHVGVVAMPDLERLQLPRAATVSPLAAAIHADAEPGFLPCAGTPTPEKPPAPLPAGDGPRPLEEVVSRIVHTLGRHRPDQQCLYTLPPEQPLDHAPPVPATAALELLRRLADGDHGHRLQPLFPYLRGPRRPASSAVGAIAGALVAGAERDGVWRSIAGRPIAIDALPWPRIATGETARLRDDYGLGVLRAEGSAMVLDDERLPGDAGHRSAEVVRLIGWLVRELTALGESMIFRLDPGDPRPELALRQFLDRLHLAGALRGGATAPPYAVRRLNVREEGVVVHEVELRPAHPIDRIVLTLTNRDGGWHTEERHG